METAQETVHTVEMEEIYRRALESAPVRGRFVRIEPGERVHVIDDGGEGIPVVHLHGTNTSALSHLMLARRADGLRSYLIDRPGCGLSDPKDFVRGEFRHHAVQFVDDVLEGLGLDSVFLVGASGGGIWATWYALAKPDRVRGLVMLGSVPALPGRRIPPPMRLLATPVLGKVVSRAIRPGPRMLIRMMSSMGEGDSMGRHPDLLRSLVAGAADPVAVRANLAELRALMSPFGWRSAMQITPDELRRLAAPTLMIWGEHDPVVPVGAARAVAEMIPQARLEVVPGGHVPQLESAPKVAELLDGFVRAAV